MLYEVEVDYELVVDFLDDMEARFLIAEGQIIGLENNDFDAAVLLSVKAQFEHLWIASIKLNLIPISESLHEAAKAFTLAINVEYFSSQLADFFLLLMDRILNLTRNIERNMAIDMQETQNILVSLQHLNLVKDRSELVVASDAACKAIMQNVAHNTTDSALDFDIDLFNDEETENVIATETQPETNPVVGSPEILTSATISNPLLFAKDMAKQLALDESFTLLATIADVRNEGQDSHTTFLMDVSLAINYMLGRPIDSVEFAKGILIHDIGLASIPDIINKKEKLTTDEVECIRKHPLQGAKIAETLQLSEEATTAVLQHHERIDGKGYPFGLKGDAISDAAKLLAIVDSFHAMIHVSPHKNYSRSVLRAIAELNACVGTHFDRIWIKNFNIFMKDYWLPHTRLTDSDLTNPAVSNREDSRKS